MRNTTTLLAALCGAAALPGVAAAQAWSGPYVGVQANWAETETSTSLDITGPLTTFMPLGVQDAEARTPTDAGDNIDAISGHIGYLMQRGEWVIGGELEVNEGGDFQIPETADFIGRNSTLLKYGGMQIRSDWAGSVRLRGGWLARPDVMIYGVGGYAVRDLSINNAMLIRIDGSPTFGAFFSNPEKQVSGWVLGAGVEWRPLDRWGLRLEYDHTDYGELSTTSSVDGFFGLNPVLQAEGRYRYSLVQDEVRLGVSYHF